jgi:lactate dehydrogenase-like 2-hydroxyacid dehydrogenase
MKFSKAVLVNISEAHFDQKYWDQIDALVEERVLITRDDPKLLEELSDCDVLMLGFQVPTGKDIIDAAPSLKLINILATAYGTVDLDEATRRGITVCNLAGYSTESVAEFSIAALLTEIRGIEEGRRRAVSESYDESGIRVRDLKGSKFGVIGLGNIGNRVAELAAGFGAHVSYWSRSKKETPFTYKELDDLLSSSTFISVNVAESDETNNLLNSDNLPLIRSDSVLISTVPPSIINTEALANRLSKADMTFISDHPDEMPAEELNKLKPFKNAIFYPPIAYISDEARIAKQEIFIANLAHFLVGTTQNKVN